MKTMLIFSVLFCLSIYSFAKEPIEYVNPQIGSISHLLMPTFNTVHLPNSMLRFNPIKSPGISDHYVAAKIYGLPLNFPGHRQRYVSMLMPSVGDLEVRPQLLSCEYDHDFETVTPYYYAVLLEGDEIQAEFTPTSRCGFYRFTFPTVPKGFIVIRGEENVDMKIIDQTTISVSEDINGMTQYAFLKFSQPFEKFGSFLDMLPKPKQKQARGNKAGLYLFFNLTNNRIIEMKYGVSYINHNQAQKNLEKEISRWEFDKVKQNARDIWNKALSQIFIKGGSEDEKVVFYTALYRTFERLVNITEDGHYYSAYDSKVHQDERPFYVDDWSWDSYRCHHPLRIILNPEQQADIIQSYVRMYQQSGWMPSFPQVYGDMKGMIGHHQAAIITDAWLKDVNNFDIDTAYEGLLKNAMSGTMIPWREGHATELDDFYRHNGYFPALEPGAEEPIEQVDKFEKRQAVAVTLEHAYDDWCLAQLSKALNKENNYDNLIKRAKNYNNVYNSDTGFMSPKDKNGNWIEPFNPINGSGPGCREYFAEISTWSYSFHVQHDVAGLIQLMGGANSFIERLDGLFLEPMYGYCRWQQTADIPDGTGMIGQFVMGNEQSFHIPYLYVYAGAPWRTQKKIRQLLGAWFRNDLMGICGDEDGGAMSAWVVFSAMGIYPVCPGMPIYVIGTPLFEEIDVLLPNGKKIIIKAKDCSLQNKYIQSASLNGVTLDRAWLKHSEIANGGELLFVMGPRPNKSWAADKIPPSLMFSE